MSWTAVLVAVAVAALCFVAVRRLLHVVLATALAAIVLVGGYALAAHVASSGPPAGGRGASSRTAEASSGTRGSDGGGATASSRYTPHRAPVPILMYHVLGTTPVGSPYPDLFLAPADFRAQMTFLKRHGFEAVTLRRVWDNWHRHRGTLPRKPVVITFDDGENAQLRVAEPILRAYHWPAVLNLVVDHYRTEPAAIGRGAVRRLVSEGWEIDSHTMHHSKLTTLSAAQLTIEVARSRAELRATFRVPVDFFCYPAGFYDERVIAAVRSAGYLAATTTTPGLATRSSAAFQLPRIRVDRGLPLSSFAAEVSRGDFGGAGATDTGE